MSRGKWKPETIKKRKEIKRKKEIDTTQCKGCLYRASQYEKRVMGNNCSYMFLMNHRRPCEPSPNCTVFKKYNKKERQELVNGIKEMFVSGERI